jgi:D-hexose-6-phosphate mutarotase
MPRQAGSPKSAIAAPLSAQGFHTTVFARTLSLRLAVQNRASHPITFEEALHSYFAVSDVTAVAIPGLGGTVYIDKTEAGRRKRQTTALITIGAETDRVYLDSAARRVIEDGGWRRRIIIEKNDAASTSLPAVSTVSRCHAVVRAKPCCGAARACWLGPNHGKRCESSE